MYLCECVSLLTSEWCVSLSVFLYVCVCMCVCERSNESASKKPHHLSEFSKLDALLHKTCTKVLRLDMCISMISSSKIAHQMWRDHPFSQRKKKTKWVVGVGFGFDREGGLDKIWKREGGQYRGVFMKKGRLGPLYQL